MSDSTHVPNDNAAIAPGRGSLTIAREEFAKIEGAIELLGDYLGERLRAFRRAVGLLKIAHDSRDEAAIMLVSAHVRELWGTLAPAVEKLAVDCRKRVE